MRTQRVRHAGSAVLDLCYVACGRVDGLWEFGLRPWDIAGGAAHRGAVSEVIAPIFAEPCKGLLKPPKSTAQVEECLRPNKRLTTRHRS